MNTKILILGVAATLLLSKSVNAFDPPTCGDPWYYQSNNRGLTFMIPDKAQHYWGSYALSITGSKYMGDKVGTLTAAALGFLWEVKDDKEGNGFSYKDLIADYLGVVSSIVNKNKDIKLWLDYSTIDKEITLNICWRL